MEKNSSYTRLRDGSWGVKVPSADVAPGDRVTVETKDGVLREETIARVLWASDDDGLSICALRPQREQRRPDRRPDRRPEVSSRRPARDHGGRHERADRGESRVSQPNGRRFESAPPRRYDDDDRSEG